MILRRVLSDCVKRTLEKPRIVIIITSLSVDIIDRCLSFVHETGSVIRILIPDVADEDFIVSVPALEVATRELQQLCGGLFFKHHDILFCDITKRLILASVMVSVLVMHTSLLELTLCGRSFVRDLAEDLLLACFGSKIPQPGS